MLGSGTWLAGPTAVMLRQEGPWTYGFLANHLWSFADTGDLPRPEVSKTFAQPFFAYSTPTGVTCTVQSESTYDWKAADGDDWTVPINVLVSKITRFGPLPFSVMAGAGYYVASPSIGPDWQIRMAFTLLLPVTK